MAYDRYTWVDGELITAQKLNHIEEGIENDSTRYIATPQSELSDIQTAFYSGKQVFLRLSDETDEKPTMVALSRITSTVAEFIILDSVGRVLEIDYINSNGFGYSSFDISNI